MFERVMQILTSFRIRFISFILVLLSTYACDDRILRRGQIVEFGDSTVRAEMPSEFLTNSASMVTVYTFGNGCVEQGHTEVTMADLVASVESYDWERVGSNCSDIGLSFPHLIDVQFARAGTATIRFIGTDWRDSVVMIERNVLVR